MYSLSIIGGLGREGTAGRVPGAFDINEKGEVVGRFVGVAQQAFSTTGTANLGPPKSQAFGINNYDVVVGQKPFVARGEEVGMAFRTTEGGQIADAAPIDGGIIGFAINDDGDVVGLGKFQQGEQAFRKFQDQPLERLGTLRQDGLQGSVAYDINSAGVTVGRAATDDGAQHAFRYGINNDILSFGPSMADLGTLGGRESLARDINDLNLIVGDSEIRAGSNIRHAFVTLSEITSSSDLGTLATDDSNTTSRAFDINNRLQIVGESGTDTGETHAFFNDPFGGMSDLNNLIFQSNNFPFVLTTGSAINESGVIVGSARLRFDQRIRYEEGRIINGTAGDIYAFRLTPTVTRLEVEDLSLDTYQVERNSVASGGALVSLRNASGNIGKVSTEFTTVSGFYDVVITYLDETDGAAKLDFQVDGRSIDAWTLDKNLGSSDPVEQTFTKRTISNVALKQGDTLSLVGNYDGGEWARVDSIELVPVDHVMVLEAEDMNLDSYQVESNTAASSGELVSLRGASSNTGSASTTFTGQSGAYDILIGYLDETDGAAQLDFQVNNQSVESWTLDKNLGSSDPVEQTFTERRINNVFLKEGDTLSIAGSSSGNEWARLDFIRLVASVEGSFGVDASSPLSTLLV
ncbi:DUF3466 family protein [Cyanobacteria bacterium FACHB-502]|nr:DUF3466 family protein [Cyanobacteria bacterium FACHB-502]